MPNLAKEIDAIPVVLDAADRAAKFPSPATNQRVHNLDAAAIERFTSGAWAEDFVTALSGSATYNPASLSDGAGVTTTVTVTGAALGDYAQASFSLDLQGILLTAWVSAANTVSVRFQNETTGAIDLASGTIKARVTSI